MLFYFNYADNALLQYTILRKEGERRAILSGLGVSWSPTSPLLFYKNEPI